MRLACVPVSFMEIHTPICFYGKEQSMLYKAKDVVEGKDQKNQGFILKWRKIQLE